MNKSVTIAISIIAIILMLVGLFFYNKDRQTIEQATLSESNTPPSVETRVAQNQEVPEQIPAEKNIDVPEGANKYSLTEGTVNYIADKLWLKKPEEKIIGTSSQISGDGWFDEASVAGKVEVNLSFDTLKSPSPARDSDLANNYVKTKEIKFVADINDPAIKLGQNFTTKVNSKLTINGVTKEVVFDVTGNISQDSLTASGSSKINITDFGIKAPSLLEVYTVAEEVELKFDIKGRSEVSPGDSRSSPE